MKKVNYFILVILLLLISIFTENVYAKVSPLVSIKDKLYDNIIELLNTLDIDQLETSIDMCTDDYITNGICNEGELLIELLFEDETEYIVVSLSGNILSTSLSDKDINLIFILPSLIKSVGDINEYGYNYQNISATLNSKEIKSYTLTDEGIAISETSDNKIKLEMDITKKIPLFTAVSLKIEAEGGGEITSANESEELGDEYDSSIIETSQKGKTIKVKAQPYNFYKFVRWTLNDEEYSTDEETTVTLAGDTKLVAVFEYDPVIIEEANITLDSPKVGVKVEKIEIEDLSDSGINEKPSIRPNFSTNNKALILYGYWSKGTDEDAYERFYGTFEEGEYYYATITIDSDFGYRLSKNLYKNIKINGEKPTAIVDDNSPHTITVVMKIKAKNDYKILEGDNQTFTGNDIVIKTNGNLEDLTGVLMDNNNIPEKSRTIKKGSTILTLKSDYLSKLSVGKHKVTFVYKDGKVDATLTIPEINQEINEEVPKTLDNIALYSLTAIISGLGLIGIALINKKCKLN